MKTKKRAKQRTKVRKGSGLAQGKSAAVGPMDSVQRGKAIVWGLGDTAGKIGITVDGKPLGGNPAAMNSTEKPVADSIQQAAAMTGHSVELLKAAKRDGCPAFNGSRVDVFVLDEWLAVNPQVSSEEQRILTIKQAEIVERVTKALDRRLAYQKRRRDMIAADEMRRTFTRCVKEAWAKLNALPTAVCRDFAMETDAIEIEKQLKAKITEAFSHIQKSEWAKCVCPKCGEVVT